MTSGGLDPERLEQMLYHESGLLGVSGISRDIRTLLTCSDVRPHGLLICSCTALAVSWALWWRPWEALTRWCSRGALARTRFPSVLGYALTPAGYDLDERANAAGGPRP
jgi:hypothetical protein